MYRRFVLPSLGFVLVLLWLWPGGSPRLPALAANLLEHRDPLHRAAAVDRLGRSGNPDRLPSLVARASDSDWRVRAAAFAALDRFVPLDVPIPPRDMPLHQREAVLLRWLDAHDAGSAAPLRRNLCELYAGQRHVELGQTMVEQCLTCHAGPRSAMSTSCAPCHADVHAQFSASSHAQSLSHLHINTVNPRTRQVEQYDYGSVQGITCAACHEPDAIQPPSPCPVSFRPTSKVCAACHKDTDAQWRDWLTGPQPRRASWPPGAIDLSTVTDQRNCIDCHMTKSPSPEGREMSDHRLTARRDLDLLRAGLDLRLQLGGLGNSLNTVTLFVTNFAGHDYPTGTTRRALAIYAEFDPPAGEPLLIATLALQTFGPTEPKISPALRPGESRRFDVPVPPTATWVRCSAAYRRDRFDPRAMAVEVASIELPLPQTEIAN